MKLIKLYFKGLWWLFIIFSAISVFAFPSILIYDNYYPWNIAEKELKDNFPGEVPIAVGYGHDSEYKEGERTTIVQRSYILIPSVFKDWSIVTIFEINEKDIEVSITPYIFILYLTFWVSVLGFGIFYSMPKIYKAIKSKIIT